MDAYFLLNIQGLEISHQKAIFTFDSIYIYNDFNYLHHIQQPFLHYFGKAAINAVERNNIYGLIKAGPVTDDAEIPEIASEIMSHFANWGICLWLLKDSSVFPAIIYGYNDSHSAVGFNLSGKSRFRFNGTVEKTFFSTEEMDTAVRYFISYQKLIKEVHKGKYNVTFYPETGRTTYLNLISYNELTKIETAMIFLKVSLETDFLPARISTLMSFFECLFVGNRSQNKKSDTIITKCNEFLGSDNDTSLYLKNAYNLRNGFLHGDKLDISKESDFDFDNKEDQIFISKHIEDIARRIIIEILNGKSDQFLKR